MLLAQNYIAPTTTPMTGGFLELTAEMDCLIGASNFLESFLCRNQWLGLLIYVVAFLTIVVAVVFLLIVLLRRRKKNNLKNNL